MNLKASELFAKVYKEPLELIMKHEYSFYTFAGGRGSLKSSFVSLMIIILVCTFDFVNVLVVRKVADTLRDSVYAQLQWAIEKLGLEEYFICTVSPMRITYKPTGQMILFRGVDKPSKLKSIKLKKGYFAVAWYEESTEFTPEEIRSVNQSLIRGGGEHGKYWFFDSFNPPISVSNWKNKDLLVNKPNRYIHKSTMYDVPIEWIGQLALDEAEYLRQTNERMYKNEILGIPTGTGANVFENIEVRKITEEEINGFEWKYAGIDWGYFPDPFVYLEFSYNARERKIYLYKGFSMRKAGNREINAEMEKQRCKKEIAIIADNSEKDIADLKTFGWNIRSAEKGSGSVEYGYKWLQSLQKIVIDSELKEAVKEFTEYEYDRDKNGNILTGYPQGQEDHYMAAMRYGTEPIWKRRGA